MMQHILIVKIYLKNASDKILKDEVYEIALNPKYYGY